jgi:hypothetical protein
MPRVHGPEIHVTTWLDEGGRQAWYARAEIVADETPGPAFVGGRAATATATMLRVAVADAVKSVCGLHLTDPRYRRSNVFGARGGTNPEGK